MDGKRFGWAVLLIVVLGLVIRGLGGRDDDGFGSGGPSDGPVRMGGVGPVDEITVTAGAYRASRAGELPTPSAGATAATGATGATAATGQATAVGGVRLPAGHPVEIDPIFAAVPDAVPSEPVAWVSDDVVADVGPLWEELAAVFPQTGLWPLVVTPLGFDGGRWWDGELDTTSSPPVGQLAGIDAEATLSRWWSDYAPTDAELETEDPGTADLFAPFGPTFPGLADPPADPPAGDEETRTTVDVPGHLALVPVERPADAPFVLGWTGPLNYYADLGPLTVVLRSWEDRFDAVVVGIGFDTLTMAVRRPPATAGEALAVAAEHYAACPDLIWQGAGDLSTYAAAIRSQTTWTFWWD